MGFDSEIQSIESHAIFLYITELVDKWKVSLESTVTLLTDFSKICSNIINQFLGNIPFRMKSGRNIGINIIKNHPFERERIFSKYVKRNPKTCLFIAAKSIHGSYFSSTWTARRLRSYCMINQILGKFMLWSFLFHLTKRERTRKNPKDPPSKKMPSQPHSTLISRTLPRFNQFRYHHAHSYCICLSLLSSFLSFNGSFLLLGFHRK